MWTTIMMGLRNLSRRRFRTVLTVLMIFGGTVAVVFSVGLAEGTYGRMTDLATRTFTGHFQITARGYHDKPSLFKTVKGWEKTLKQLAGNSLVAGFAPRVETGGLLSSGKRTLGVGLIGVDPEREPRVTTISRAIKSGEWFKTGPYPGEARPILLGAGVARRLRVSLGDELSFVTQAADGSLAAELFTLTGIIRTGAEELDGSLVLARLGDTQEMLVLGSRIHRIVGLVGDLGRLAELKSGFRAPPGDEFMTWAEILPQLEQTIEVDRGGMYITLAIIMAVVLLGVGNTMMMVVLERTREFGVMLALGSTPGKLLLVLVGEAGWLTLLGVGGGTAVGSFLNYVTTFHPLPLGNEPLSYGGVVISEMVAVNGLLGNLYFPILILVCGLLAGVLPALRAARLNPAEALRPV